MRSVTVFGSTGSIGKNVLEIVRKNRDKFNINVLTAGNSIDLLIEQAIEFQPEHVVINNDQHYQKLKNTLLAYPKIHIHAGENSMSEIAKIKSDVFVCAIVGSSGLMSTYNAIKHGTILALANKESLVVAGSIMIDQAKKYNTKIIPVDSEHSAIFQVFEEKNRDNISSLILTASGGAFWQKPLSELNEITPEQAIKHPNWSMGQKISIDSSTLMNKGLEIIEAFFLFNMPIDKIDVVIHPQSIVHSMVSYEDGSVLAHMGEPDIKTPISYAMSYPHRIKTDVKKLSLFDKKLDFFKPDLERLKALKLAKQAIQENKTICFNAANEIAVKLFIDKVITFPQIVYFVEKSLNHFDEIKTKTIEEVLYFDKILKINCKTMFEN
jgi:1-deoxy-D-xylulose-5-phosphate reductoisomerase